MKYVIKVFLYLLATIIPLVGKTQKIDDGISTKEQKRIMNLYKSAQELNERFEKDTLMPRKTLDSLIVLSDKMWAEIQYYEEGKWHIENLGWRMEQRGNEIFDLLQQDSTLSVSQRDSLSRLIIHLGDKGAEIRYYNRIFYAKGDSINQLNSLLQENALRLNLIVKKLIAIASNRDVYPSDRVEALEKLALSRHPAALDYLVANITTVFSRDPDPGMFGWMSFYAYEPDYPYFNVGSIMISSCD